MKSSHSFFVAVFVVVSMLLLPSMLLADVTGSINGVVRDPSQAAVKGVRIKITNTQTNLSLETGVRPGWVVLAIGLAFTAAAIVRAPARNTRLRPA